MMSEKLNSKTPETEMVEIEVQAPVTFSPQHLVSKLRPIEVEKVDAIIKDQKLAADERLPMAMSWLALHYQANNLKLLAPRERSPFSDFILLFTMENHVQAQQLAYLLKAHARRLGLQDIRAEGLDQGEWILLSMGQTTIHLFTQEMRSLYNLDQLYLTYPHLPIPADFYHAPHDRPQMATDDPNRYF